MSAARSQNVADRTRWGIALAHRLIAEQGLAEGALTLPRPEVVAAIGAAVDVGRRLANEDAYGRMCLVCGCTESIVCVVDGEPCGWASPAEDLCTACAPYLEAIP